MGKKNTDYSIYLEEGSYDNKGKTTPSSKNAKKAPAKKTVNKKTTAGKTVNKKAPAKKTTGTKKSKASTKKSGRAGNKICDKKPFRERFKYFWTRPGHTAQKIIAVIAIILVILIIAGGIFIWSKLSMMDTNGEDDFQSSDIDDIEGMDSITDAHSLNDFLYKWANNGGKKMSSKYVKNVLLIGKDSRSNLADSMILVSVNEKTKQTTLVSFYRDSYTYIKPTKKKGSFAKLNAAYSKGGANCLIKTIEDDYKIKIDDYMMVDYNSFPKVINSLGGVDVYVKPKEAAYFANNVWESTTLSGRRIYYKSGMNHLDGEGALLFCRMRHMDSDTGRTERQRRVITSILTSFKSAGPSRINSAINTLLPNVKTSMKRTKVLSFTADAISGGWLNFKINQTTMPPEGLAKGGFVGTQWVWIVDYEASAYQLQNLLYGKSNISLDKDRVSPIGLKPTKVNKKPNTSGSNENLHTTHMYTKPNKPDSTTTTVNEITTVTESTTAEESTSAAENETTEVVPETSQVTSETEENNE